MKNNNISIYIHIPFCASKCYYCDFISFIKHEKRFEEYKNALINEIKSFKINENKKVYSIFIGGGTPSIFPVEYITEILYTIFDCFNVSSNAEITIETNPESVDIEKLKVYKSLAINRVSIGLQAWQDEILKKLGRIHNNKMFIQAYYDIVEAGFENVNVDLMFSLPSQTIEDFDETIENILALKPKHISAYSLIIEESTLFYNLYKQGKIYQTSDEVDRNMYYNIKDKLTNRGYTHYEISNFAIDGYECKHNIVYWKRGDYIGFGLGSHSMINNIRFSNTSNFSEYINGKTIAEKEILSKDDIYSEYMFLGLRMIEGININHFADIFNVSIYDVYENKIKKLCNENLIFLENGFIKLTPKGIDLSNMVFVEFLL